MLNIIKSQMYGIRHNIFTYISVALTIVALITGTINNLDMLGSETPTGSLFFATSGEFMSFGVFIIVSIGASCVSGWDFDDNTINYEILYGHSRCQVYWARTFTAVVFGIISGILFIITPSLIFTIINGWGYAIPLKEAVIRCLLALFPILRISAFAVFLSFLVRKSWGAGIICFFALYIEIIISLFKESESHYMASENLLEILSFSNMAYGFANGEDVMIFKDTLSGQFIGITVILSVVMFAGTLWAGYALFRKRNLQ